MTNKKPMLATALAMTLLAASVTAAPPQPDHARAQDDSAERAAHGDAHSEWGYTGATGPQHWAELSAEYEVCARGQQESPIDIRDAVAARLPALRVEWKPSPLRVVNNGHTLQVATPAGGSLGIDGKSYRLSQFHFHHPSEHLLDGRRFPLELHFVHQGPDGVLGVIGVFVQAGRHNPTLQAVLDAAPRERGATRVVAGRQLDPTALLPAGGHFRYEGSLTTPPCSETVDWIVMSQPIEAAPEQIEAFSRFYPMNARPIQALNRRFLLQSQ